MKLNKGLYRDSSLEEQPVGTWVGGTNWIYSNKYSEIINEPGFTKSDFKPVGTIIGIISTPKDYIVFQIKDDSTNELNEIGIIRNEQYQKILVANLHFNINFPIFGEAYYNFNDELIVVFSDGHNKPKILNLDNLPFKIFSNKTLINPNDIYHLDMFSSFNTPIYHLSKVNESNGNLLSGVYYLTIQYELPDKSYGNFLQISNPISIIEASSSGEFNMIYGCKPNTTTSKSISLLISKLDTRYKKLKFGIIHKSGGAFNCYISNSYNISNSSQSFTISSTENLESISLENVLIKSSYYSKIKALTNINNTLYIANLETDEELKYQKYANNIEVEWVYEDQVGLDKFKGSHKDPVILFDRKSFMPGEIYAFYIRWIYKGGHKTTQAFHIPGREAVSGDDGTATTRALEVYPMAKKFHMQDTIPRGTNKMSYWQNSNEKYPSEGTKTLAKQEFNGEYDYNGIAISGGKDLTNQYIRHHKFPTSNYLAINDDFIAETVGGGFIKGTLLNASQDSPNSYTKTLKFNASTIPLAYLSNNNLVFTNINSSPISVFLHVKLQGTFTFRDLNQVAVPGTANVTIIKSDGITNTSLLNLDYRYNYNREEVEIYINTHTAEVSLLPDEYIQISASAVNSVRVDGFTTEGEFRNVIDINYQSSSNDNESNLSGKILGIKLKNIYVPEYIKENCDSFEVLYAERSAEDMSVLSQGLLSTVLDHDQNPIPDNYFRFYGFDLLSTKKQFKATHLVHDLDFTKQVYLERNEGEDLYKVENNIATPIIPISENNYIKNNTSYINIGGILAEGGYDSYKPYNLWREEHINLISTQRYLDQTKPLKLITVYAFTPDIYTNFTNKKLVRTGKIIDISHIEADSYITETNNIYGGDVHFNLHGVMQVYPDNPTGDPKAYIKYILYPCYTILNAGYRFKGEQLNEIFYPAFNLIRNNNKLTQVVDYTNGRINSGIGTVSPIYSYWQKLKDAFSYEDAWDLEEYYPDILDYSSVNNLEPVLIFDESNIFTSKLPYRIHKSNIQFAESRTQNWRVFNPADYYESVSNRGEIVQLETDGNDLLILHKYSLFVARNVTTLNVSESVVTALGNSNIFDTKPIEIIYDKSGYVGCSSKWAVISFKHGVLIIDRYKSKIFIYNNLQVEDISAYGLEEFFKSNLQYNKEIFNTYSYYFSDGEVLQFDDGETVDYANATVDQMLWVDNPFTQFGYHAVWDDINSRILITKVYTDDNITSNDSFTLSYYPELKQWGWFHDYLPNYSISNRGSIIMLKNNNLYYTNRKDLKNYYFDEYANPYIDIVFNQPYGIDKLYQSLSWLTKYLVNGKEDKTKTFTSIRMFNEHRDSNDITLNTDLYNTLNNLRFIASQWNFNSIRDLLKKRDDLPLLDAIDLTLKNILVSTGKKFVKDWYENNLFIDRYMIVRLTHTANGGETDPLIDFKILNINANFNLITR